MPCVDAASIAPDPDARSPAAPAPAPAPAPQATPDEWAAISAPAPASDPAGTERARSAAALDRLAGRIAGLRPEDGPYTLARGLRVPTRDGELLAADHYAPGPGVRVRGTLLVRTPYRRGLPFDLLYARIYAARGYHVLMVSSRGTYGSTGRFTPMSNEVADGRDVVAWLRAQPWFDGRLGTIGLSYLGYTQWCLLTDPPPELVTSVVCVGPHDFAQAMYSTGAFTLRDSLSWSDLIVHQEETGLLRYLVGQIVESGRLRPGFDGTPLADAGLRALDGRAFWYPDWVATPDVDAPFWADKRHGDALDAVDVPVMLVGGWQDLFLDQTLEQFARLRRRGIPTHLTVGPWRHSDIAVRAAGQLARRTLDWLDNRFDAAGAAGLRAPVGRSAPSGSLGSSGPSARVFVGGSGWRELPDWPPPSTPMTLYARAGGGLSPEPPPADFPARLGEFRYDPAQPTPSVGGRILGRTAGARDSAGLAARSDVLAFTGAPLPLPVEIMGRPVAEISHGSDVERVDLYLRLCEVDARGRSRPVSDGYLRLDAASGEPTLVRIEMDAAAHRFPAGSRIQLLIAGGAHPRFARNLGSAEPPGLATTAVASHRKIGLSAAAPSRVLLPVPAPPAAAERPSSGRRIVGVEGE